MTVFAAFAASAARTPQADFLFTESVTARAYGIATGPIGWADAAAKVDGLRAAYANAGHGHGHRVGLLLDNRPDFLFHWFALNALGVSVVPINSELRSAELTYLIGHSEIQLVVSLPHRHDDLRAAAAQAGVDCDVTDASFSGGVPTARSRPPQESLPVDATSECALLYTSGTTGRPKGCMLNNAYFLRAGQWYAELDGVCSYRRDAERLATPLPLNHVNAMAFSTMVVLVAGGCLVQLDRFHPGTWLESVREGGATIVHYLGVMPAMLLSAPPAPSDRDHSIRWGFGRGALRFPAGGGLGDDRDRRRGLRDGQPRAAPDRDQLLRPA